MFTWPESYGWYTRVWWWFSSYHVAWRGVLTLRSAGQWPGAGCTEGTLLIIWRTNASIRSTRGVRGTLLRRCALCSANCINIWWCAAWFWCCWVYYFDRVTMIAEFREWARIYSLSFSFLGFCLCRYVAKEVAGWYIDVFWICLHTQFKVMGWI